MTKERMIADSSEKGIIRYKIIRDALGRYGDACEKGYYLEAITIMESLITDRLESRAIFLGIEKAGFNMLGALCKKLKGDPALSEILPEVSTWRESRNSALHELAKNEKGDNRSFSEKYDTTKQIAEKGIVLFRKVDAALKQSRKL